MVISEKGNRKLFWVCDVAPELAVPIYTLMLSVKRGRADRAWYENHTKSRCRHQHKSWQGYSTERTPCCRMCNCYSYLACFYFSKIYHVVVLLIERSAHAPPCCTRTEEGARRIIRCGQASTSRKRGGVYEIRYKGKAILEQLN